MAGGRWAGDQVSEGLVALAAELGVLLKVPGSHPQILSRDRYRLNYVSERSLWLLCSRSKEHG